MGPLKNPIFADAMRLTDSAQVAKVVCRAMGRWRINLYYYCVEIISEAT